MAVTDATVKLNPGALLRKLRDRRLYFIMYKMREHVSFFVEEHPIIAGAAAIALVGGLAVGGHEVVRMFDEPACAPVDQHLLHTFEQRLKHSTPEAYANEANYHAITFDDAKTTAQKYDFTLVDPATYKNEIASASSPSQAADLMTNYMRQYGLNGSVDAASLDLTALKTDGEQLATALQFIPVEVTKGIDPKTVQIGVNIEGEEDGSSFAGQISVHPGPSIGDLKLKGNGGIESTLPHELLGHGMQQISCKEGSVNNDQDLAAQNPAGFGYGKQPAGTNKRTLNIYGTDHSLTNTTEDFAATVEMTWIDLHSNISGEICEGLKTPADHKLAVALARSNNSRTGQFGSYIMDLRDIYCGVEPQ